MTKSEASRPMARPAKLRTFRLFDGRPQLTPEELAAKNAAATAKKIREIFSRKKEDGPISN